MKRLVAVVQIAALLCAVTFVVLLFANEPDEAGSTAAPPPANSDVDGGNDEAAVDGAEVFANRCASCHGSDAGGALGPKLSEGRVVERFPDIADQIAVIAEGQGGMPAFGDRLSEAEIQAVAEYLRTL